LVGSAAAPTEFWYATRTAEVALTELSENPSAKPAPAATPPTFAAPFTSRSNAPGRLVDADARVRRVEIVDDARRAVGLGDLQRGGASRRRIDLARRELDVGELLQRREVLVAENVCAC
jgi:malic enzyme